MKPWVSRAIIVVTIISIITGLIGAYGAINFWSNSKYASKMAKSVDDNSEFDKAFKKYREVESSGAKIERGHELSIQATLLKDEIERLTPSSEKLKKAKMHLSKAMQHLVNALSLNVLEPVRSSHYLKFFTEINAALEYINQYEKDKKKFFWWR